MRTSWLLLLLFSSLTVIQCFLTQRYFRRVSSLRSTVTEYTCDVCSETFTSRNQLFRHLRESCAKEDTDEIFKQSWAFLFGYTEADPPQAGVILLESIAQSNVTIISQTQAQVCNMRSKTLQNKLPATGDVMVVTLEAPEDYKPSFLNDDRMQVHAIKRLDIPLHAERACTQYIYEYALPIEYLPRSDELKTWMREAIDEPPPNDVLIRLKKALKQMESPQTEQQNGRFGLLARKKRQCWHNYADPEMRGARAPNHENVWRAVDRARIQSFRPHDNAIVIEFRGDIFLPQQIQRMVGTAVAVTNGWLPRSFIKDSLDPAKVVETPIAPSFEYLSRVHFHFEELSTSGESLFESEYGGSVRRNPESPGDSVYRGIIESDAFQAIDETLGHIERVSRRISVAELQKDDQSIPIEELLQPPKEYLAVLERLRDIVASGQWPPTSAARSSVIRTEKTERQGSFTVVNEDIFITREQEGLPLGNTWFPHLVRDVFALEEYLSKRPRKRVLPDGAFGINQKNRPLSSHCAINSNAGFTPHVDSGEGAGQSLSMIVGLGDYIRGEILVEGTKYEIRYDPLEFDGWRNRHWTNNFDGERFSLVWFTPAPK